MESGTDHHYRLLNFYESTGSPWHRWFHGLVKFIKSPSLVEDIWQSDPAQQLQLKKLWSPRIFQREKFGFKMGLVTPSLLLLLRSQLEEKSRVLRRFVAVGSSCMIGIYGKDGECKALLEGG
jgi:hypothetical protein